MITSDSEDSEIEKSPSDASISLNETAATACTSHLRVWHAPASKHSIHVERLQLSKDNHYLSKKIKLLFDVVMAFCFLVVIFPVFLVIWGIVSLDGGPALYGHVRIGRKGVPFKCLKFRSMVTNSDVVLKQLLETNADCRHEWETTRKLSHDPRITMIGRFFAAHQS